MFNLIPKVKTTSIYTLTCPISGQVRYVGKSNNPSKRLYFHLREKSKTHKTNWIASLRLNSLTPIVDTIDEVPFSEWQFWEKHYIKLFKSFGANLVNATVGGDGLGQHTGDLRRFALIGEKNPRFGVKDSKETIEKRSLCLKKKYAKTFYQFDLSGKLIDVWENKTDCEEKTGIRDSDIVGVLSGTRRTAKGLIFSYNPQLTSEEIRLANATTIEKRRENNSVWCNEETRRKISDKTKGRKVRPDVLERRRRSQMKPILQFDLEGNFIREFESLNEAKFLLNPRSHGLSGALKGKAKTWCGYKCQYKPIN